MRRHARPLRPLTKRDHAQDHKRHDAQQIAPVRNAELTREFVQRRKTRRPNGLEQIEADAVAREQHGKDTLRELSETM